jgi:hypothetical protein
MTPQLVSDGRRPVGTIALDPAGLWRARCMDRGVVLPLLLGQEGIDCGQHRTKAAAVEAVLRVSGTYSVWDM